MFIFLARFFLNKKQMKKISSILVLLLIVTNIYGQKPQSVAYIDMEYILENIPEYIAAQNLLDTKVLQWKKRLDNEKRYIEVLKTDLANEKEILTKDLVEEKEEEITLKQEELRRLESLYFGPNGDLFNLRKQLVAPVQDQIYNVVQDIASKRNYDFILDKSSEPIMLYSNKKYDISDLILSTLNNTRKINEKNEQSSQTESSKSNEIKTLKINKLQEEKLKEITKKKAQLAKQLEERKAKALKLREEKRKEIIAKKAALKKKREELIRKKLEEIKRRKEEAKNKKDNKQ